MASTDQRAGFRLPWSGSTPQDEDGAQAPGDAVPEVASEMVADEHAAAPSEAEESNMTEAPVAAVEAAPAPLTPEPLPTPVMAPTTAAASAAAVRKPARFVTELVRAMRSELEKHRETTLEQFRVDAKAHVETVHGRSAEEVAELRRMAEEDIAGIKEWSKAEIARIRAESDERMEGRKSELEAHLEEHAALIEREIEKVQARVVAYEQEVDAFFKSLDGIDDPAAFAAAAQQVPEPPSLEEAGAEARSEALADLVRGRPAPDLDAPYDPSLTPDRMGPTEEPSAEATQAMPAGDEAMTAEATLGTDEVPAATDEAPAATDEATPIAEAASGETVDASPAEAEAEAAAAGEAVAETDDATTRADDPRLAALAMSEDLAAAESAAAGEAATAVAENATVEPMPEIEADIVAARLNGLVPEGDPSLNGVARPAAQPAGDTATTQVIVVGLVSVASIASFKRQLSRLPGIHSVGVSSGPDGEFIFKANHDPAVAMQDVLPTLTGYSVRVVSTGDGIINVSARDPEN
ncbi:MAG: hypothetical protein ACXWO7_05435 [Candidatus Limnocylindrales bacterium]